MINFILTLSLISFVFGFLTAYFKMPKAARMLKKKKTNVLVLREDGYGWIAQPKEIGEAWELKTGRNKDDRGLFRVRPKSTYVLPGNVRVAVALREDANIRPVSQYAGFQRASETLGIRSIKDLRNAVKDLGYHPDSTKLLLEPPVLKAFDGNDSKIIGRVNGEVIDFSEVSSFKEESPDFLIAQAEHLTTRRIIELGGAVFKWVGLAALLVGFGIFLVIVLQGLRGMGYLPKASQCLGWI